MTQTKAPAAENSAVATLGGLAGAVAGWFLAQYSGHGPNQARFFAVSSIAPAVPSNARRHMNK